MPGRPPSMAATNPKPTVVHNPTNGLTPATNEKPTASGTMAKATAMPAAEDCNNVVLDGILENHWLLVFFTCVDGCCLAAAMEDVARRGFRVHREVVGERASVEVVHNKVRNSKTNRCNLIFQK